MSHPEDDEHVGLVGALARHIVAETSAGTCTYGRVCPLCDCFADGDGGAYRDQCARQAARAALAEWERTR